MSAKSKLSTEQDKINIGVLNTIPMDHAAEAIRTYRLTYPHVFIELVVGNNKELTSMLQSHKLDLIFTTSDRTSKNFTLLFEEHLSIAASAQHPLAKHNKVELKQLHKQPFIERINCESWDDIHGFFQKHNIQPYSVCRAENDESILSLVTANLGVSIMPVRDTPYNVRFIQIKNLNIARPIGICVSSQPLAPCVQDLYETIMRLYKKGKKKTI